MKKLLRLSITIVMCLVLCEGFAQDQFRFATTTDTVVVDGFYKINLLPAIVAKCRPTLADLRLLDATGKQVPYIIKDGEIQFEQTQFEPFKKLSETTDTNYGTKVLIESSNGEAIDNLVLILKNSTADRTVNVSGSSDAQRWYIIKEFVNLETTMAIDDGHFVQSISFPKVAYKYFQITFNGKQRDPMFIEQVGTYNPVRGLRNYFTIPTPQIIQHESSNKYSYVRLVSTENYRIDKLQLFASGARYYQRNILFSLTSRYNDGLASKNAILSSNSDNIFFLNLTETHKTDTIYIRVQNDDNPVLHIDSAKVYQDAYAIYAWLKAGQKYKLVFGNDSLRAPVYDLSAFKDSIQIGTPVLNTGAITANAIDTVVPSTKSQASKIWLWSAIFGVLALLILFTASLLKQINRKDDVG
ncbi:MAG: hypothetical protein V4722_26200 [Bacteroidota bacterium]